MLLEGVVRSAANLCIRRGHGRRLDLCAEVDGKALGSFIYAVSTVCYEKTFGVWTLPNQAPMTNPPEPTNPVLAPPSAPTQETEEAAYRARQRTVRQLLLAKDEMDRQADELSQQWEWLAATLANMGEAVMVTDAQGRITFMNPGAEAMTGRTASEWATLPLEEVFPVINLRTRDPLSQALGQVLRDGVMLQLPEGTALLAGEGGEIEIEGRAAPVRDGKDRISGAVIIFHDVTQRRRMEAAVRQSERQLRTITNASPALIAYLDADCRYRFVNQHYAGWFNLTEVSILGRHMREILGEEPYQLLEPHVTRALSGESVKFESELPHPKEGTRFVEVSYIPDADENGPIRGFYVRVSDISERKRAEETLQQTEGRLLMAMEAGQMGTWQWLMAEGKVIWSPTLEALHGLAPGTFGGTFEDYQKDMHPEDRERVLEAIRESAEGLTDYHVEYRIIKPDGTVAWIEARGKLFLDRNGKPERMAGICMDITQRKEAEAERARLAGVLEKSLNEIYIFDAENLRFEYVNEGALRNLGYTMDAMREMTPVDIKPDFTEEAFRELVSPLVQGEKEKLVFHANHRRCDRTLYPVEVHLQYMPHEARGVFTAVILDITERKKSEEERERLLASEQAARFKAEQAEYRAQFLADASASLAADPEFEVTLGNLAVAAVPRIADGCSVHLVDPDGKIRLVGAAHVDPEKRALVAKMYEQHPEDPNLAAGLPSVLRTGQSLLCPVVTDEMLRSVARDDEHLEMLRGLGLASVMIVPLIANGRTFGAITLAAAQSGREFSAADLPFAEDLAARAATTAENARLYLEVQHANAAKDHFMAVLSHELRTPLTPVLMTVTDLERDESIDPAVREQLSLIRRNVELEARLIDDLLDSTRISRGKLQLQRTIVDARELLRRAVAIVEGEARAKEVRMEISIGEFHGSIDADPARIQQVFWNVVKNAVKFTPQGGSVRVCCEADSPTGVRVAVSDDGIGIAPENLENIFHAFDQGNAEVQQRFGGLGLGLAISRALLEMHGGEIIAESEGLDRGATFTIRLPGVSEPSTASVPRKTTEAPRPGLCVLLVDDHADTLETLKRLVARRGYEVRTAGSIADALEVASDGRVDLLVSDIGLPDGHGTELLGHLEARLGYRPPAIAMSGFGMEDDLERSRVAGFAEHLTKPVEFSALSEALARLAARSPDPG